MTILNDLSDWANRLKRLHEVAKDARSVELSEAVADLRVALSGWKVKFADISEENLKLKTKLKELEQKNVVGEELVFRDGAYYRAQPVEGQPKGPFRPVCWEGDRRLIGLRSMRPAFRAICRYRCPKCGANI